MDGIGDCAGVLLALKTDGVNIAIGLAAARLLCKSVLSQCALDSIETIF
jgi:hypothetical protein